MTTPVPEGRTKLHDLKCDAESFDAIDLGAKRAEVRLNDRGYRVGDLLVLRRQVDGAVEKGSTLVRSVMHVFEGGRYGIEPGYVVLSLALTSLNETRDAIAAANAERDAAP